MISKQEYLKELIFKGAHEKIPVITESILDRINYELSIIEKQDFVDYFILYSRIVEVCNELRLLRSPGRGSAPHSLINFCLDITKIDPIVENFIFERFLQPQQKRLPDIDIDIPKGHRENLIERLKEKYPEYHIYLIAFSAPGKTDYKTVLYNGNTYKQHPCGIVITLEKLTSSTFLYEEQAYYLALDPASDPIFNSKIDIIELEYLNRLQLILNEIEEEHHPYRIPLGDKNVFDFFTSGDLEYIFQFNTLALSKILADFKPKNIDDLCIVNATYRRGLMGFIPTLLANKNNGVKTTFNYPVIDRILAETYGVLVYQETFLQLAHEIAEMSFTEAETWRRKMMSNKSNGALTDFISRFTEGCRDHSTLTENDIDLLVSLISRMIRLTFSRSHSLSYSLIGYWGAYYKTHFRNHFDKAFRNDTQFQPFELYIKPL